MSSGTEILKSNLGILTNEQVKIRYSDSQTKIIPQISRPFFAVLNQRIVLLYALFMSIIILFLYVLSTFRSGLGSSERWSVIHVDTLTALGVPSTIPIAIVQEWPLWRDPLTVVVIIVMALTPWLTIRQWRGYEELLPHMLRRGSLVTFYGRRGALVSAEILSTNRWIYNTRHFRIPLFLATGIVCKMILDTQLAAGVGSDGRLTLSADPRDWWVGSHFLTEMIYFSVSTTGLYFVSYQNIIGCRVILAIYRIRKRIEFRVDILNHDGCWGWRPVRKILGATYGEIVIHGIGLLSIIIATPRDSIAHLAVSIPAAQWLLTLPIYIGAPSWIINKGLQPYRRRQSYQLGILIGENKIPINYSLEIANRIDRWNSIPKVPFLGFPEKTLFSVAQVANFSTCYAVLVALLSGG